MGDKDYNNTINGRINELQKSTGLSGNQFALKAGLRQGTLYHIMHGRLSEPSFMILEALCETYNVNANWLILGEGKMLRSGESIEMLKQENGKLVAALKKCEGDLTSERNTTKILTELISK